MNRKGFTLIEVLAVIVILGIILIIAIPNVLNIYKNSRLKSEEIFINRLSQTIDSYIKLNNDKIGFTSNGTANKDEQGSIYTVNVYNGTIIVQDVIDDNLISASDYINAGNKALVCNVNAEIDVYRDSDFVYCFKVKKDALGCLTDEYKGTITSDYVIDTCTWSR